MTTTLPRIGIVGAHGYSGRQLAGLLLQHPQVQLSAVFTTTPGWRLSDELPVQAARSVCTYPLSQLVEEARNLSGLFLATPAEVSADIVHQLGDYPGFIIDLSGAFRLHHPHFHYGLCPWKKTAAAVAQRIANPGCYATCALMSLLPLLMESVISPRGIIIDAKSGISGAGRQANAEHLFGEIYNDFFPYKVGQHPHTPEITYYCADLAGAEVDFTMINYVLPLHRGIQITLYADAVAAKPDVAAAYHRAYQDYPLVRHGPYREKQNPLRHLKTVAGSARMHINYQILGQKVVIFSTIDNLMKGAASQAVENLNQLLGLSLETGLLNQGGLL
jgi:N-acetyl-gamma-glutamyl-phosphate reductase